MGNMNNQGKRPEQYKDSTRFAWYGVLGMIITLLLVTLLSSCSIIKTTEKCDKEKKECCSKKSKR